MWQRTHYVEIERGRDEAINLMPEYLPTYHPVASLFNPNGYRLFGQLFQVSSK